MKKNLLKAVLFSSLLSSQSFAATLICGDMNLDAKPYNTFILNFEGQLYAPKSLSLSVVPSAFLGSEEVHIESPINGCQNMKLAHELVTVSFECDADGDAGFGSIDLYTEGTSVLGSITFPEGTMLGQQRIAEGTKFEFSCPITM